MLSGEYLRSHRDRLRSMNSTSQQRMTTTATVSAISDSPVLPVGHLQIYIWVTDRNVTLPARTLEPIDGLVGICEGCDDLVGRNRLNSPRVNVTASTSKFKYIKKLKYTYHYSFSILFTITLHYN